MPQFCLEADYPDSDCLAASILRENNVRTCTSWWQPILAKCLFLPALIAATSSCPQTRHAGPTGNGKGVESAVISWSNDDVRCMERGCVSGTSVGMDGGNVWDWHLIWPLGVVSSQG